MINFDTPSQLSQLVLIVDNSRAVTGGLNAIRHATGPLREQYNLRFEYVLPTGSSGRGALEADGYVVHELPFIEISRRKLDLLFYFPMLLVNSWRLLRLVRKRGAGVVHQNDFYNLTGYMAKLLSFGRVRLITHVRFLPQTQFQPLARIWRWLAENYAEQVLCVSSAVRSYFGADSNIQVLYDPLPSRGEKLPSHSVSDDSSIIKLFYLGNYINGKGQNFGLKAFRLAYARNPSLRLYFAGGDMGMAKNRKFRSDLQAEVRDAKLEDVVFFDGFVADTEFAMKSHDIMLNFSEAESFSLTCLDALYYGMPLIATDCGGPAELFESGKSGLLVPNRDVTAMANAICELAGSASLRQAFSAASRIFVRQKFAPAVTYHLLAACYHRVISRL